MLLVVSTTEKRDQARTWKQSVGAIMGALGTPPSSGTQNYGRDTSSQYKETKSESGPWEVSGLKRVDFSTSNDQYYFMA